MIKKLISIGGAPNGLRIDRLSEPLIKKMKLSGGYYIGVGIETGNPEVMKTIKKQVDLKKVKNIINILHKNKIIVSGFFICGLRNETKSQINDSIKFALSVSFDRIQVSNYIPYPGSEDFDIIFNIKNRDVYIKNINEFQKDETIPPFQTMSLKSIIKIQKKFMFKFYLRFQIILSLIKYFRFSQLTAIIRHPWIQRWFKKKVEWYTK